MRENFSPHAVSSWMTDEEAERLIKGLLISSGVRGPVTVLADPSPERKRVARTSH